MLRQLNQAEIQTAIAEYFAARGERVVFGDFAVHQVRTHRRSTADGSMPPLERPYTVRTTALSKGDSVVWEGECNSSPK